MREYKVVILGPRGAGKTVYLGCLFHKLSTPGEAGYYLKVPFDQQKKLTKIFSRLIYEWPEPTDIGQTDNWNFEVMVRAKDGANYKALGIHYYDYGGGRMTDLNNPELEREMEAILEGADVFLGLLDGQKLHAHLAGKQTAEVKKFWAEEVQGLCEHMNHYAGKTIHFLISKWDLFEDSDKSLQQIRSALLSHEAFKNLVTSRSGQGLTRLVPVSSVGFGFAELTPEGKMAIKTNGASHIPQPLYVEWPFACILPDLIQSEAQQQLEESRQRENELKREVKANLSWWEVLTAGIGKFVRNRIDGLRLDAPLLRWVADRASRAADRKLYDAAEPR